jgi:branched-chain amino acid transport system permease protein
MDTFLRALVEGLLLGGVYALVVLGVVVVNKSSKVFNMAHGEIMMMLAFFAWWLLDPRSLPLWISLVLVLLFSTLIGLSCERFLMRPLIGRPMLIPFIATLILGLLVKGLATLCWGGRPEVMPQIFPAGSIEFGGVTVSYTFLFSFIIAAVMFFIFVFLFRYTKTGLLMRGVAEDHVVSQSLGVSVKRIFALSWVIGCLSAAIGGLLLGSMFIVDSELGTFVIIRALPVALLGGIESIPGCFMGAFIIGIAESLSAAYVDPHVMAFREVLPFILMVLVLMIRPYGLLGLKRIERI